MASATATNDEANVTAVEVAGFKSANLPVRVNFRDITVLAGANSQLAEDGSYGDWPVDFDTVELKLQDR